MIHYDPTSSDFPMKLDEKHFFYPNPDGKTVAICGLGETRQYFIWNNLIGRHDISIGVNDIFRYFPTDYLLVMDEVPHGKLPYNIPGYNDHRQDAYDYIVEGSKKVKAFFTNQPYWKERAENYTLFNIIPDWESNYGNLSTLGNEHYLPKSCNSPYTAICLAWAKFRPTKIILYGVDFNSHMVSKNNARLYNILEEYKDLSIQLYYQGCNLAVYSKESGLSQVLPYLYQPARSIRDEYLKANKELYRKRLERIKAIKPKNWLYTIVQNRSNQHRGKLPLIRRRAIEKGVSFREMLQTFIKPNE